MEEAVFRTKRHVFLDLSNIMETKLYNASFCVRKKMEFPGSLLPSTPPTQHIYYVHIFSPFPFQAWNPTKHTSQDRWAFSHQVFYFTASLSCEVIMQTFIFLLQLYEPCDKENKLQRKLQQGKPYDEHRENWSIGRMPSTPAPAGPATWSSK